MPVTLPMGQAASMLAPWQNLLDTVRSGEFDLGLTYVQVVDQALTYQPVFYEELLLNEARRRRSSDVK